MNSCLAITLLLVGLLVGGAESEQFDFEPGKITDDWLAYLKEEGYKGDKAKWVSKDVNSTLAILKVLDSRRKSSFTKFYIEMSNTVESKCNEVYVALMNDKFYNYWYLPNSIQRYMDYYRRKQFEVCRLHFEVPMKEAAEKTYNDMDRARLSSMDNAARFSYSFVEMLRTFMKSKFSLVDSYYTSSLGYMRTWCDHITKPLEPGVKVLASFPKDILKPYMNDRDPTVKLVAYYQICRDAKSKEVDRAFREIAEAKKAASSRKSDHEKERDREKERQKWVGYGLLALIFFSG